MVGDFRVRGLLGIFQFVRFERIPCDLSLLRSISNHRTWVGATGLLLCGALTLLWPLPESASPRSTPASLQITALDHSLLREAHPAGRGHPVSVERLPSTVVDALLAIEDRRFFWHLGVDPLAIGRAVWSNWTHGRIVSGGSTLTMQVAELLRGRPPRSLGNKLVEMHLALRLELRRSKREILSLWLNRVSFGNRAHGIEAAAQLYFGKSARDLTPAQAAYLVGLPRAPGRYNPFRHPDRAERRQHRVLRAMEDAGVLTWSRRKHLAAVPIEVRQPKQVFRAPHLTQWLIRRRPSPSASVRTEIRTTIDPSLQNTVADLVKGHVERFRAETLTNASAVVLDNRTGAIRAYVGSADFWDDWHGGQNDGVRMLRQPGSALKPFTYTHALTSRRYTPASVLADIELNMPEASGAFSPENYDDTYHGPTPLRQALASSFNVPAVRLAREFGPEAILETLHSFGFASLDRAPSYYGAGLTLGNGEVKPIELARAYSALARGGTLPPVHAVRWMRTVEGDTLRPDRPAPRPTGVSPAVAHLITNILDDPAARAPGFGRGGPLELPFPVAVKTGTSKDYRDSWTVGYTPRYTVAVWAGNFDGTPMDRMSGVAGAAPLFHSIMRTLGSGGEFDRPSAVKSAMVCPASGKRPGTLCPAPQRELFLRGTIPADTCNVHRMIAIDRRTGDRASSGTDLRYVTDKVYTVYPERYHRWMREHDIPLPPPRRHVAQDIPTSSVDTTRVSDRLRIRYPADEALFYLDPVLRSEYQKISLRGTAPDAFGTVRWFVDGEWLASGVEEVTWQLTPGRHEIELRARDKGQMVRSRAVRVRVVGASEMPGRSAAFHRSP